MAEFDQRSEDEIATLVPSAQVKAREFLRKANAWIKGYGGDECSVKIINGTRTYAEQDALYAQGRTKRGPIVTNARGGQSNHNFGVAFDIGVFRGKEYLGESNSYEKLGPVGRECGLEWGGDWKSIHDAPHYQCKTGKSVHELDAIIRAHGQKQGLELIDGLVCRGGK